MFLLLSIKLWELPNRTQQLTDKTICSAKCRIDLGPNAYQSSRNCKLQVIVLSGWRDDPAENAGQTAKLYGTSKPIKTSKHRFTLHHEDYVNPPAFPKDGRFLITSCSDYHISTFKNSAERQRAFVHRQCNFEYQRRERKQLLRRVNSRTHENCIVTMARLQFS